MMRRKSMAGFNRVNVSYLRGWHAGAKHKVLHELLRAFELRTVGARAEHSLPFARHSSA